MATDDSAESDGGSAGFSPAGSDDDLRRAYLVEQVVSRRARGDLLMQQAREDLRQPDGSDPTNDNERCARQALAAYRASLDWAEDTDLEEGAHERLDLAGRWVRDTFGCTLDRSGTEYTQTCPVALGHNRIGLSIGGSAARLICSLCGQDVSECEHLPATSYMVPGGSADLGWCRVCCKNDCTHLPTETYRAAVVSIIREMDLVEVSIVHKPANPEARIHSMSVRLTQLRALLGDAFQPGMDVSCDRCLSPCEGLTRHDLPHP